MKIKRLYIVLIIAIVLFNIYLFGIALPYLISDKHSDPVLFGIGIAIADIWSTIEIGRYLIKMISNKNTGDKSDD